MKGKLPVLDTNHLRCLVQHEAATLPLRSVMLRKRFSSRCVNAVVFAEREV